MSLSSGVSSDIYGDTGNAAELFSSTDATAGAQSDRLTPKHGLDDVDDTHLNKRIRVESDEEALLSDSLPTSSAHLPDSPPASSAHLPVEVWQSVFSHLPPPELFRMMRVNKCLKSYLDGTYIKNRPSEAGSLRILDVESLLARWRTLHVPNMPKPLESHSELEMWRLIRGIRCEFCGKVDEQPRRPIPVDVWHGGPSMSTTRVIWPFASRSCGECLFKSCEKVSRRFPCTENDEILLLTYIRTRNSFAHLSSLYWLVSHTRSLHMTGSTSQPLLYPKLLRSLQVSTCRNNSSGPIATKSWRIGSVSKRTAKGQQRNISKGCRVKGSTP